ncbi:enoyl-ACP reductase FabI [Pseudodonghicola flavimaris]|uniref:Enoyl-[acyl-carrier-protein] reductase [NADH] n=1 Tax=Pseudodonghicola flavimaris TaxID=3050036 RepID=A0ABT7EW37_9RHOB|nr:enoyl-ACP reductase FabI [Pseudodonghicola flavimaris]MDK3016557.1 enoyl-ACP reductase FabI [Pseudodonghicola flavimaris]
MQKLVDLTGKRGLVVGVANEHSIAAGCARAFRAAGAEVALTYLNDIAKPYVQPVADEIGAPMLMPLDLREEGALEAVFEQVSAQWGKFDFLLHSVAFAPREDLHTSVVNCSSKGFSVAMDISCHSFLRMARLSRPLMTEGGALMTVSYYGADRVVEDYNLMGPVKAALEASVRYAAADLAAEDIRVFALSAGPIKTRAASGIAHFDELIDRVRERTPSHHLVSIEEVGRIAAFLASEAAGPMSGSVIYADNSFHVMA